MEADRHGMTVLVIFLVFLATAGCMSTTPNDVPNESADNSSPNVSTGPNASKDGEADQDYYLSYNMSLIQTKPSPLADQIIPKRDIISRHNISALAVDEINLYYIDSDQNWWSASSDGKILGPAPGGNGTVIAGTTVPTENRTGEYVWKIRIGPDQTPPAIGGAYTAAVNATSGEMFFEIVTP